MITRITSVKIKNAHEDNMSSIFLTRSNMDLTIKYMSPDEIKLWLKKNRKTYAWFAKQLFVSRATVNGWLSTNKTITPQRMAQIETFVEGFDKLNKQTPHDVIVLKMDAINYDLVNKAASLDNKLVREWALNAVIKEAKRTLGL